MIESLHTLPSGWKWSSIGEVADTQLGKMLTPKGVTAGELRPYLRSKNVQWGRVELDDVLEMRFTDEEFSKFQLKKGDLLVCEGGEAGRCAIWNGEISEIAIQNALHRVRPRNGVMVEWLDFYLSHLTRSGAISAFTRGIGIAHLPQKDIRAIPIPLPPLDVQAELVGKIEAQLQVVAAGLEEIRRGMSLCETLIQSAYQAVLHPDPTPDASPLRDAVLRDHEERWRQASGGKRNYRAPQASQVSDAPFAEGRVVASLDELTRGDRTSAYGVLQPGPDEEGGIPFVRVGDLMGRQVAPASELKHVSPRAVKDYKRTELEGGELLVSLVGTIGRCAVAGAELKGANVARAVGMFALSPCVNADYVSIILSAPEVQQALVGAANEVARKTLNLNDLRAFPIPLVSLDCQLEAVARVSKLEEAARSAKHDLRLAESTTHALETKVISSAVLGIRGHSATVSEDLIGLAI